MSDIMGIKNYFGGKIKKLKNENDSEINKEIYKEFQPLRGVISYDDLEKSNYLGKNSEYGDMLKKIQKDIVGEK